MQVNETTVPEKVLEPLAGKSRQEVTPAMQFSQDEQTYHRHLTLGIEDKLRKNRMIKDIKLQIRKPVEKTSLSSWERKYGVHLPVDLKDFLLTTNGLHLSWSLEHAGDILKIGDMNINQINQLLPLDSPSKANNESAETSPCSFMQRSREPGGGYTTSGATMGAKNVEISSRNEQKKPLNSLGIQQGGGGTGMGKTSNRPDDKHHLDSNFQLYFSDLRKTMEGNDQLKSHNPGSIFLSPNDKVFILDQSRYGWACLVYPGGCAARTSEPENRTSSNFSQRSPRSSKPLEPASSGVGFDEARVEIWFLDSSFQIHYLAPTFSHYYRMMLFHLGLPQWQYRFTPYGLSSWAEQMFWLVAPHLLVPPKISKFPSIYHGGGLWSADVPAEAAAPNPTPNVLSGQLFRRKLKQDKEKIES